MYCQVVWEKTLVATVAKTVPNRNDAKRVEYAAWKGEVAPIAKTVMACNRIGRAAATCAVLLALVAPFCWGAGESWSAEEYWAAEEYWSAEKSWGPAETWGAGESGYVRNNESAGENAASGENWTAGKNGSVRQNSGAGENGGSPEKSSGGKLPKVHVAADGRTFQTADGKPFVPMGVNYYRPGTGWAPQLWKKFDAEATRRDFAQMRELGVNCVRVFLTFGSFFQDPDQLSPEGLAKFDQFLQIAEQSGIYVHPTGPDHWEGVPEWARGDRFADEKLLAAQQQFWRLLAQRYRARNVIFAYDLLNEPEVRWDSKEMRERWNEYLRAKYGSAEKNAAAWGVPLEQISWGNQPPPEPKDNPDCPILLDYQLFREQLADRWVSYQVEAIKKSDPDALVTVGLIQWSVPVVLPSVRQYAAFRPKRIAQWLDFLEIHFYPLAGGFYDYTRREDEKLNLAYLHSIVREAAAAGKPVVVAEFGWYGGGKLTINRGVHPPASQEQQARWCRLVIESTAGLATGWLNWGLFDQPEARDVSQLTGLLTADGQPKAWAREFQRLSEQYGRKGVEPAKIGPEPVLDWDRAIRSPKVGRQFLDQYMRQMPAAAAGSR